MVSEAQGLHQTGPQGVWGGERAQPPGTGTGHAAPEGETPPETLQCVDSHFLGELVTKYDDHH